MKTLLKKNKNKILVIVCLINVLTSYITVEALTITGSLSIAPCLANCLRISAPNQLALTTPIFLDNTESREYVHTLYNLDEKILIENFNETGGFNAYIQVSNLIAASDNSQFLPYDHIGILTYNNSSTSSVDGDNFHGLPLPTATQDPVENGVTSEPFTEEELTTLIENETNFDSYFQSFTGVNPNSDPIEIMTTPNLLQNNAGAYQVGVCLFILFPNNHLVDYNLNDDDYNLSATLTVTSI